MSAHVALDAKLPGIARPSATAKLTARREGEISSNYIRGMGEKNERYAGRSDFRDFATPARSASTCRAIINEVGRSFADL